MKTTAVWVGVVVTLAIAQGAMAQGPASEYYMTAGQNLYVVQGEDVIRTWSGVSGTREYPIVVIDDVRTLGGLDGDVGARYDLDGNDLGDRYSFPEEVGLAADATTDGENHYIVDFTLGGVWKFDRDWGNGEKLFDTPVQFLGCTYDPTDNTLWISQFNGPAVQHRDMDGNILGTFNADFSLISCLALDHADGTLWMGTQTNQGTFTQYSKSGERMQSVTYGSLANQNTLGGEFAFGGGGCGDKAKLKARCSQGGAVVKGKLKKAEPERSVTFRLDGEQDIRGATNNKGKAKAKWKNQKPGPHTVTVCELEERCGE